MLWNKRGQSTERCIIIKIILIKTFLEIPNGELFTILGHNGAGKSTLINILTGNISPSSGTAKINENDLLGDENLIEEMIGLCPQHDILWEELTAKEHIELYANLRGRFILI
jgi:ABC-type multidrug transport system ATPase subunit